MRLAATSAGSAYHSSRNAPYRSTARESALLIVAPSEQSLRFHKQHNTRMKAMKITIW